MTLDRMNGLLRKGGVDVETPKIPGTWYAVESVGKDGVRCDHGRFGFTRALMEYRKLREQYGTSRVVILSNPDQVDLGNSDGLTDRERELVDGGAR